MKVVIDSHDEGLEVHLNGSMNIAVRRVESQFETMLLRNDLKAKAKPADTKVKPKPKTVAKDLAGKAKPKAAPKVAARAARPKASPKASAAAVPKAMLSKPKKPMKKNT